MLNDGIDQVIKTVEDTIAKEMDRVVQALRQEEESKKPNTTQAATTAVSASIKAFHLYRQPAVGIRGIYGFDSGCNLSGMRRVYIHCDEYSHHGALYPAAIKRLYFEFERPLDLNHRRIPFYNGPPDGPKPSILRVEDNDPIVRVDVWFGDRFVCGIRFHFRSGSVSQVYGAQNKPRPYRSFAGNEAGSQLVGLHGGYDINLRALGFTFATKEEPDPPKVAKKSDTVEDFLFICSKVFAAFICFAFVLDVLVFSS